MRTQRITWALVLGVGSAVVLLAPPSSATSAEALCPIEVADGMTQPIYDLGTAVEQRVWIQTPLDSDRDGARDRVVVDISRPQVTDTQGCKVPVVFEHSPYRKDTWDTVPYPSVEVDELPQNAFGHREASSATADESGVRGRRGDGTGVNAAGPVSDLPGSLDNYYVPRGYAVVLGQSIGTADADGCPTSGDAVETLGTKAVIDWLNGRAPGFDAAGAPVEATWTTGAVGMVGTSYNGTLPNQVATTGVEGLKTIVPVSAISSWYDYYRANGLVVAPGTFQGEDLDILADYTAGEVRATTTGPGARECADEIAAITAGQDRVSGDYSRVWRDRDYVPGVRKVRASVFVVHGLNDWNVKTEHFAAWWDQLARYGVPRKIWLHQGGHGGPGNSATYTLPGGQSWTYQQTVNRWFDYWLWDVPNGITAEPRAILQREDSSYVTYSDWPDRGARATTLRLSAREGSQPGGLGTQPAGPAGHGVRQSFVDEGRTIPPATLVADPDVASPNRLVYRSPSLDRQVRLSGRPEVRLSVSVDNKPDANLTAYLVDYSASGSTAEPVVVTRGWVDPQNRYGRDRTVPLQQGKRYGIRWTLQPKDYVFTAGHRIGLVVFSTDQEYTLLPLGGTRLTVDPRRSQLTIPVVGGKAAFG